MTPFYKSFHLFLFTYGDDGELVNLSSNYYFYSFFIQSFITTFLQIFSISFFYILFAINLSQFFVYFLLCFDVNTLQGHSFFSSPSFAIGVWVETHYGDPFM